MAMTIMNNPSAMLTLGELNKNVSKLGKQLKKVSSVLNEVKMYYYAKRKNTRKHLRIACVMAFLLVSITSAGLVTTNEDFTETLMYGDTLSAEDLGFPVDSYGLLMVGE